jgi:hypothetical protein
MVRGDTTIEKLIAYGKEFGQELLAFMSKTAILLQLGIVASILLVSRLAAWKIEPKLEAQIRKIESPDHKLLRILIVLLRRLDWVFFVVLSGIALLLMRAFGWQGSEYVVTTALLLALAWLVIALLSQMIRSRLLGRMVSILVWVYVALVLLGALDEAALLLDAVGFSIGTFRLSLLLIVKVVVLLGALLWGAISLGNFFDNRLQRTEELTPSLRVLLGKVLKIGWPVRPRSRPHPVHGVFRRHRRGPGLRPAEGRVQLHLRHHHPDGSLHQAGRYDFAG